MAELFSDDLGNAVLSAITFLAEDIHRLQGEEEDFDVCAVMQTAVETYQHQSAPASPKHTTANGRVSRRESESPIPPPPEEDVTMDDDSIQHVHEEDVNHHTTEEAVELPEGEEWEDDNDTGYVQVFVSEEEFFEIEEEAARRNQLEQSIAAMEEASPPNYECEYDEVTVTAEEDALLESDLLAVEESLGLHRTSVPFTPYDNTGDEEVAPEETAEVEECGFDEVADEILAPPRGSSIIDAPHHSSRRSSEIMGQRKVRGLDGEHRCFDLKVIFEPYKTGFEAQQFDPPVGSVIAGKYEVDGILGTAAFSTALQCIDHHATDAEHQWVCLKVIKNSKDFFDQSLDEIKLLQYINSRGDPDKYNVLRLMDFFYTKEHLILVTELLRENLYEFGRHIRDMNLEPYFTLPRLKKIMKQVLEALQYIHSLKLIHCDIKPENIVIKSYSRCEVKLIDFGSSAFITDNISCYIQSRSYRAPEVILGLDPEYGIDIWSSGGVLAEMHTGYVLFQNDSIQTMLARIQGILGDFPESMLKNGTETAKFFNSANIIYEQVEDGYHFIYPKRTTLRRRLQIYSEPSEDGRSEEDLFVNFVQQMLQLNPSCRPSASQMLLHPWLDDVDSLDVSYITPPPE